MRSNINFRMLESCNWGVCRVHQQTEIGIKKEEIKLSTFWGVWLLVLHFWNSLHPVKEFPWEVNPFRLAQIAHLLKNGLDWWSQHKSLTPTCQLCKSFEQVFHSLLPRSWDHAAHGGPVYSGGGADDRRCPLAGQTVLQRWIRVWKAHIPKNDEDANWATSWHSMETFDKAQTLQTTCGKLGLI